MTRNGNRGWKPKMCVLALLLAGEAGAHDRTDAYPPELRDRFPVDRAGGVTAPPATPSSPAFEGTPGVTPGVDAPPAVDASVGAPKRALYGKFTVRATHSDNVNLDPANGRSDLVTQINPGFVYHRDGGRVKADVAYTMRNLFYRQESDRNDTQHQLAASANAELAENLLFLDAKAGISQQADSLLGPVGVDTITGHVTDVYTAAVSPRVQWRLGDAAIVNGRYTADRVRNRNGSNSDSTGNSVQAGISSGTRFQRSFWSVDYRDSRVDFKDGSDSESEFLTGTAGWAFTPRLRISLALGHERHDFVSPSGRQPRGTLWSVGANWQPGPRTELSAAHGHRFFGTTNNLSLSHRMPLGVLEARYNEEVTLTRSVQLDRSGFGQFTFLHLGTAFSAFDVPIFVDIPVLTEDEFIQKRFIAGFSRERGKSRWTLAAFNTRREFAVSQNRERQYGGIADWRLRVTGRTTLRVQAAESRVNVSVASREDKVRALTGGLSHQLGKHLDLTVEARRQERKSNQPSAGFKENAVMAGVTWTF